MYFLKKIVIFSLILVFIEADKNLFTQNKILDISTINKNNLLSNFISKYKSSITDKEHKIFYKKFVKEYFRPWNIDKLPYLRQEVLWGVNRYGNAKNIYGENRRKLTISFMQKLIKNANFKKYNTLIRKGITIRNTSLKVFPTNKIIFKDFQEAGEGYPFDYNQNSLLFGNHPILISHFSQDRAWVFVESEVAAGWLSIKDIAYVDDKFIERFKRNGFITTLERDIPIYDKSTNNFIFYAKLATTFPLKKELKYYYLAYTTVKDNNFNARFVTIKLDKKISAKRPLKFNKENLFYLKNFLGEKYGYGGFDNNRDCSSMMRDYFGLFGIWIPRNSRSQTFYSKYIDIQNKGMIEKEKFIIKNAIPFETTLYIKGHTMLYVGNIKDRAYVLHSIWGIKTVDYETQREGRLILGQTILTSLHVGEEIEEIKNSSLWISKTIGLSFILEPLEENK